MDSYYHGILTATAMYVLLVSTCPKMPLIRQFPHKMRNESFDLAQYPVTHCLVCDVDMIERKKAKKWEAHSTDYNSMDTDLVSYTT